MLECERRKDSSSLSGERQMNVETCKIELGVIHAFILEMIKLFWTCFEKFRDMYM